MDEFRYFTVSAKAAALIIRDLDDNLILGAARSEDSDEFKSVKHSVNDLMPDEWISIRCALEAYRRGIMTEHEKNMLTR